MIIIKKINTLLSRPFNRLQQQRAVKQWRKRFRIDAHLKVFNALYREFNGFSLSKAAREQADSCEYVYGEISFEPFIALLAHCNIDSQTVFYDLGSGLGKAVIACAMVFDVKKACGIELFSSLQESAQQVRAQLIQNPDYAKQAERIEFIRDDFFYTPYYDATLIFINATSFFGDRWKRISQQLEQLPLACQVISTSKPVQSDLFTVTRILQVPMSWGVVTTFIQKKPAST